MGRRSTVERVWEAHGLKCAVLIMDMGHRCGYAAVPEDHPWHGIAYNEAAPTVPVDPSEYEVEKDIGIISAFCYGASDEEEREKYARTPEFQIAVHGGLTYSGKPPGDLRDTPDELIEQERERYVSDELTIEEFERRVAILTAPDGWWFGFDTAHADDSPIVWTHKRLVAEVERLAEQLSAIAAFPVLG